MSMINRRSLLRGAALAGLNMTVAGACGAVARASQGCRFCAMGATPSFVDGRAMTQARGMVVSNPGQIRIARSSGDAETDRFFGLALLKLATAFKVRPGFAFYDDGQAPNAVAIPETLLDEGVGTVLMGMRLFSERMALDHDAGVTVIAICAHEFGHIHQYQRGYASALKAFDTTAKPLELHADFLAGTFLALRRAEYPGLDLGTVGTVFEQLGDTDFANPQHHGTADERIAALKAGFDWGSAGQSDIHAAADAGLAYVRQVS